APVRPIRPAWFPILPGLRRQAPHSTDGYGKTPPEQGTIPGDAPQSRTPSASTRVLCSPRAAGWIRIEALHDPSDRAQSSRCVAPTSRDVRLTGIGARRRPRPTRSTHTSTNAPAPGHVLWMLPAAAAQPRADRAYALTPPPPRAAAAVNSP